LFPPDIIQQNMLETVAWIGVLFLLLETGLEMDFSIAWRQRGPALKIALSDIFIPLIIALVPCLFLPGKYLANPDQRILFALFMATVMTISAMPVAARLLQDLNIFKAEVGYLIMSALAVNDIIGWILFTVVLGLFSHGALQLGFATTVLGLTIGFAFIVLTFGRRASTSILGYLQAKQFPEPATSLTFACLTGLLFGALTQRMGVHALFGFFLAGVVVGEARTLSQETRQTISQMVHAIFVPLFFANIGLKIDFAAAFDPWLVAFVCIIGIFGRYAGAWTGVRLTKTAQTNRDIIAIAHTPGGMMEIVVAVVALESGLINAAVFVAILFSAVFSSVITGPWMKSALKRRAKVSLTDLISKETILPALKVENRDDAIRELVGSLASHLAEPAREHLIQLVLTRENDFGTGIGQGVAVPHVRMDNLRKPIIVFGRSSQGIDWDAPDGKPVRHLFLILTPSGLADVHMQVLAEIARIMCSPKTRETIDRAEDAEQLFDLLMELFSGSKPVEECIDSMPS
jgi:Kef-type K+ transport system membrane component KefB/mannitol/fructose-specific phosphotransferase system IIA component (Ntr-type)